MPAANALITQGAIQAAFVAISSRIVGSAFRFLETLNPRFQQTRVISDPKTVFVREAATISMAWGFSLLTNIVVKPLAQRKGWGNFGVQMATAIVGTTIAEALGRFIAYRKTLQQSARRSLPAPLILSQPFKNIPPVFQNRIPPQTLITPARIPVYSYTHAPVGI